MSGRLERFQPPEVINAIVEEIKNDKQLWTLILDRELERKEFEDLAKRLGKRADLEPEAFPPPKRPTSVVAILEFLERKHSKEHRSLAGQVALEAGLRASRELGLSSSIER